jgi:hypothetical protein
MALCILSNIAAGASAKEFIVANEDILRKVTNYMVRLFVSPVMTALHCSLLATLRFKLLRPSVFLIWFAKMMMDTKIDNRNCWNLVLKNCCNKCC